MLPFSIQIIYKYARLVIAEASKVWNNSSLTKSMTEIFTRKENPVAFSSHFLPAFLQKGVKGVAKWHTKVYRIKAWYVHVIIQLKNEG